MRDQDVTAKYPTKTQKYKMHEDKMRLHGGKRGLVISSAGKPQFHSCIIKVQRVGRRKKMY